MRTIELLGARMNPLSIAELNGEVVRAVDAVAGGDGQAKATAASRAIIANHNLHSLYLYHADATMRDFYAKACVVHIDGMPLIWLARIMGKRVAREQRVTYVDWLPALMDLAAGRGWKVFFLGSKPGVGERAKELLCTWHPGLHLQCHHGYFDAASDSPENRAVLELLEREAPHLVLVGMGMPRQEHWILQNLERLPATVLLTAGACMDYVAGEVPVPPRWMGRVGLEWLYRLGTDFPRLWRRYLVEPWLLAGLLARQRVKQRLRGDGAGSTGRRDLDN